MSDRLPPLNSLRAFEAAARHLSLKKAAEELHVSPGAISQQIRTLERDLGTQLFHRLTRALELTEAGRSCLPELRKGFDSLAKAVAKLRPDDKRSVLTVSVAPAFAVKYLVPRLPRFAAVHPGVELRISASLDLIDVLRHDPAPATTAIDDLRAQDADLAIRFGTGSYAGCQVDELCSDWVTALCSPALLNGEHPLRQPGDLRHHTLLHDNTVYLDEDQLDWAVWLQAAGVDDIDASRGPRFNHSSLALEAAADSMGVALSLPKLAAAELASGRLVTPFELRLPSRFAYYLVCSEANAGRPEIAIFRNWLLGEMET
ncbi:MAG: transcriptional regulator GcvA [Burkholderiales bacterium]|nr:transcriptional regulator GcvA [Burkholderiales bacterium]